MNRFKSKKWVVTGLLVLIFVAVVVFAGVAFGTDVLGKNFRAMFLGSISRNPFKKESQVRVSLVDSKLNLSFDVIPADKAAFTSFIQNWFGLNEDIKTLSFGIDEKLASMLSSNLPADLNLKITGKSLEFNSLMASGLQNPLIKSDIEFATGSSKLNAQFTDASKYQLRIEDPADLANYATASGILTASSKISGLFQTLPKVATIEVNVNGKSISGRIVLK